MEKRNIDTVQTSNLSTIPSSFFDLTAREIMTNPVQCANEAWTVKFLIEFLTTECISGTAVTNESGELTGVVSISDVLHFENLDDQEKSRISMDWSDYAEYVGYHVSDSHVQKMMQQASANCLVGQIMTHEVLSVDVNENITSIAKLMSSKHIHRIFVSEQKKLIGIVSSMDVIYAMAEHLPHRAEVESGNRPDRPAQLSHAVL